MPRLTDAQRRAAESIRQHVLVSAGAGCGKTMVLVERYLEVLKQDQGATVGDVIAVTFTRKAAEEMRSRLKARLKEMMQDEPSQARRWAAMLAQVDRARIGTIHSLCESILKAHPAEAAVDPQFEILDDLARVELLHESVDAALRELIDADGEDRLLLLEYPVDTIKQWVVKQLESVGQYKEARLCFGAGTAQEVRVCAEGVLARLEQRRLYELLEDRRFEHAGNFVSENHWPDPKSPLESKRAQAASLFAAIKQAEAPAPPHESTGFAAISRAVRALAEMESARTAGGEKGKPLRQALSYLRKRAGEFVAQCPPALNCADEQAFALLSALLRLVDTSLERLTQLKLQAQKLDYNDLIMKTHELLCSSAATARQAGHGIRAIFVDEFQDTNRMQAQLLAALCPAEARLFLIGDDKQSIYKFQGADVSTFNEWKSKIDEQRHGLSGEGLLLDLSTSFRSHPSIVHFVNRFFAHHFGSASEARSVAPHKASHQALKPARSEQAEGSRIEVVVCDAAACEDKKQEAQAAMALEARAVAAWILEKLSAQLPVAMKDGQTRPVEFGDFAILVQRNDDFGALETALSDKGVPYVTFAGAGFLERQEILDIENLLRFLSAPQDDLSLLAVLRSPFFSINDGVIHKVFLAEPGGLWQRLQSASRLPEFDVLKRPAAILKQLLGDSKTVCVSEVIRQAISISGFDIALLALPNGRQKSRNSWKMAAFAANYDHLGITDFVRCLEAMRQLGAGKQADAPLAAENAVKLMTIHKSKGLEFPVVVLPVLGRRIFMTPPKLLVHPDFGMALDTTRSSEEEKPAYFQAANRLNCDMDAEEKKRLLYVAMTRARDYLALFLLEPARSEASFRLWIKEALGLQANDEEEVPVPSGLKEGEHYTRRYLDEPAVAAWEVEAQTQAQRFLPAKSLDELACDISFELLAPLTAAGGSPPMPPSWTAVARVTSGAEQEPHPTAVGNLFHAVMQRVVSGHKEWSADDLRRLAASDEVGVYDRTLADALVARCLQLLRIYDDSALKETLQSARRLWPEVSYTLLAEGGASFDKRPDLIFQDQADHWHVVDFKTDRLGEKELPAKINEHSNQVLEYAQDLCKLTNAKARAWLYFAHLGVLAECLAPGFEVSKTGQLRLPFSRAR